MVQLIDRLFQSQQFFLNCRNSRAVITDTNPDRSLIRAFQFDLHVRRLSIVVFDCVLDQLPDRLRKLWRRLNLDSSFLHTIDFCVWIFRLLRLDLVVDRACDTERNERRFPYEQFNHLLSPVCLINQMFNVCLNGSRTLSNAWYVLLTQFSRNSVHDIHFVSDVVPEPRTENR